MRVSVSLLQSSPPTGLVSAVTVCPAVSSTRNQSSSPKKRGWVPSKSAKDSSAPKAW